VLSKGKVRVSRRSRVMHGDETGPATFKIIGRSPHDSLHGLYRALILAHGECVTRRWKRCFTREYGHTISLLIMVRFYLSVVGSIPTGGAKHGSD
jgi:hypothetical protein